MNGRSVAKLGQNICFHSVLSHSPSKNGFFHIDQFDRNVYYLWNSCPHGFFSWNFCPNWIINIVKEFVTFGFSYQINRKFNIFSCRGKIAQKGVFLCVWIFSGDFSRFLVNIFRLFTLDQHLRQLFFSCYLAHIAHYGCIDRSSIGCPPFVLHALVLAVE